MDDTPSSTIDIPSIIAGFARAIATQVYQASALFLREALGWWFKTPIKLFRPNAVNPWFYINTMAIQEGSNVDFQYMKRIIKRDGIWTFARNTFPIIFLNSCFGILLFNSFTVFEREYDAFVAGGLAGLFSTCLATPMNNLARIIPVTHMVKHRHRGLFRIAGQTLRGLPGGFIQKHASLYRGFWFQSIRDSTSFGLFFGVFSYLKQTRNYANTILGKYADNRMLSIGFDSVVVVASGAMAGAAFQLVSYPCNKIHSKIHKFTPRNVVKEVARNGLGLYKGIGSQLIRVMPPSAIALFVYDFSRHLF